MIRPYLSISLAAILFVATDALRAEPPAAKQFVTVEVTVIEVNRTKLRAAGFDWDIVKSGGPSDALDAKLLKSASARDLTAFLQALKQYNLAKVLSEPRLMTLSGRPASLAIGDHLKLDVVPIVLESGRIRVEHRLELGEPKLKSDGAVEVDSGQAVIASQVKSEHKDAAGKVQELETLVIVRAGANAAAIR
jgi:Flp pilus assembly secretin CpaC